METSVEVLTVSAAVYAALVSTAALALEVRRWVESGPRLTMSIIAVAKVFGGPVPDDREFLSVRVSNRGALPTTITNMGLLEFSSPWKAFFGKPSKAAVIADPSVIHRMPLAHLLAPGAEWSGAAVYDDNLTAWSKTGRLYVAIYTTHRNRPLLRRVRRTES